MTKKITHTLIVLLFLLTLQVRLTAQDVPLSIGYSPGQLAQDVAVAANGDVHVLTKTSIQVFRGTALIRSFSIDLDTDQRKSNVIKEINIAPNGHIYVLDVQYSRFIIFDAAGQRLRDLSLTEAKYPTAFAFDKQGDLYVADYSKDKIEVFGPDHVHKRSIPGINAGSRPFAITLDMDDNVYLLDNRDGHARIVNNSGALINSFEINMSGPTNITLDTENNIYIGDLVEKSVKVFSQEGQQINSIAFGHLHWTINSIRIVDNKLYVVDEYGGMVSVYDLTTGTHQSVIGGGSRVHGNFMNSIVSRLVGSGVAFDAAGNAYAVDYGKHQVLVFNPQGQQVDIQWRSAFRLIKALTISPDGQLYVADEDRISIFDLAGNRIGGFTPTYSVAAIVVTPDRKIFTLHASGMNSAVHKYSSTGTLEMARYVSTYTSGFAVDKDFIYLCSFAGSFAIHVLDHEGEYQRTFDTPPSSEGRFYGGQLALDTDRNIYLLDSDNHVSVFANDGTFITQYRDYGDQRTPQFVGNLGIAVRGSFDNGTIAVLDNLRLQVFQTPGTSIRFDPTPQKRFGDDPFSVTATSRWPIQFSSADENVATVNGNTVTLQGAGIAGIEASYASGAWRHLKKRHNIVVNKAFTNLVFETLEPRIFGEQPFELDATSNSNQPINFASDNDAVATVEQNIITLKGPGSTIIRAWQTESANYESTEVEQVLEVRVVTGNKPDEQMLIALYPNPATEYIMMNKMLTADQISIVDIMGRAQRIAVETMENNSRADIRHLNAGTYVLSIKAAGETYTTRFIKR